MLEEVNINMIKTTLRKSHNVHKHVQLVNESGKDLLNPFKTLNIGGASHVKDYIYIYITCTDFPDTFFLQINLQCPYSTVYKCSLAWEALTLALLISASLKELYEVRMRFFLNCYY